MSSWLQWLHMNASHAFAPVFRHQPDHPVKDCEHCAWRRKNKVHHIKETVPLEYQADAISSTAITRFSVTISKSPDPMHEAFGKSMYDVFRNEFQCRISRILDAHQSALMPLARTPSAMVPLALVPSPENIRSEVTTLAGRVKVGDHVLVYAHGLQTPEIDALIDAFKTSPNNVHYFVWLVCCTTLPAEEKGPCFRYAWSEQDGLVSKRSTTGEPAASSKVRVYVLYPSTAQDEAGFTEQVLHTLQQGRYRVSVYRLLQAFAGKAAFVGNFPVNTKTSYFGFG